MLRICSHPGVASQLKKIFDSILKKKGETKTAVVGMNKAMQQAQWNIFEVDLQSFRSCHPTDPKNKISVYRISAETILF